jgi:hypothetical protein
VSINIELLDRALEWAERSQTRQRNPGEPRWDQSTWLIEEPDCGTSCCIAGYIVLSDGQKPDNNYRLTTPDGRDVSIRMYAQELLGLSENDADYLFGGVNNLTDLRKMRDNLAEGRYILTGLREGEETW